MIVFLSAMPQEIARIRGLGTDALALATGMGRWATEVGVAKALAAHPHCALVSLGFSGGTQPGLRPGELVLCRRVHWHGEKEEPRSVVCHPALLEVARRAIEATSFPWREGEGLTQNCVATSPKEKEALGRGLGVQVVDMESFWVGWAAQEKGLPFLSVRAVLDPQEEFVPDLNPFINADGRLLAGKAIRYFVLRPQHWHGFLCLGLRSRRASRALGAWAIAFTRELIRSSAYQEESHFTGVDWAGGAAPPLGGRVGRENVFKAGQGDI
ncbi:MAG: hypothetical protein HY676_02255 [Chloroflexi bacterium]|nr:hypothetical protein [Chloroflexota bacterium]